MRMQWRHWRALIASVLVAAGVVRYFHTAVYGTNLPGTWTTLSDQLRPLIAKSWHGTPFENVIPLIPGGFRYGPMFYLIAGPIVAATRSLLTLHIALTVFGHLCFWLTLYLIDRRLFRSEHWTTRVIFVGVALNFTPELEALRCACLDTWELLSIAAGFFVFTSGLRWRREIAAAPLVAGVLTKLMPALALLFIIARRWRAVIVAAATTIVILSVGQVLYGWTMGFGFPQRALNVALMFGSKIIPLWWENDSPRGLVFKALAGFALQPGMYFVEVAPSVRRIVDITMNLAALALLAWVIARLWRWRESAESDLLVLGGFSSAVVVHHLISPYTTHQYMPSMLIAYAFIFCCLLRRSISRTDAVLAAVSLILIGNIAPKTILVRLLGLAKLNAILHSAPHLDAGQMYTFYGFPGVGAILLGIVVLRLQRNLVAGGANASAGENE